MSSKLMRANLSYRDAKKSIDPKNITILDIEDSYDAYEKPFPTGLPTSWTDRSGAAKKVTWISCFEVRKVDGSPIPLNDRSKAYIIEMTKEGDLPVYFNGQTIEELPLKGPVPKSGPVRATLTLGVGDPPVGWAK